MTSHPGEQSGTLVAETDDLRLVGDVALRAGLPVHGLEPKRTDLEELFFELTAGTNRNETLARPDEPADTPRGEAADPPAAATDTPEEQS